MMPTDILTTVLSTAGLVLVAIIGLQGSRDEKKATHNATLVDGQNSRIQLLEDRLDRVEERLDQTRAELWRFQAHASALRTALRKAIAWITDAVEWMNGPRATAPPSPPDSEAWNALLEGVTKDLGD